MMTEEEREAVERLRQATKTLPFPRKNPNGAVVLYVPDEPEWNDDQRLSGKDFVTLLALIDRLSTLPSETDEPSQQQASAEPETGS